jgi:hypothetical protein
MSEGKSTSDTRHQGYEAAQMSTPMAHICNYVQMVSSEENVMVMLTS